jgi:hypothetical protein
MKIMKIVLFLTAIAASTVLAGCSSLGVKPWQRGNLAKPAMSLGCEPVTLAMDSHIYFSKEATSGGRDFSGGGCGCN